jgi:hypothetical protein
MADVPTTNTRLECIEEFLGDERMFFDVRVGGAVVWQFSALLLSLVQVSAVLGRFLDLGIDPLIIRWLRHV